MNKKSIALSILMFAAVAACSVLAFDPRSVNGSNYDDKPAANGISSRQPDEVVLKLQIMLDRAHFSPGIIDGRMGDNTINALREFEKQSGFAADGHFDQEVWNALSA